MIASYTDYTTQFNNDNGIVIDMSGWDYIVAQFVAPTGTISISGTNDSGAVEGAIDGNARTATNFTSIQATKLSDGTSVTSVAAAGLFKLNVTGRYVKFGGAAAAATKALIQFAKIS